MNEFDKTEWASRIRDKLTKLDMTQAELADRLGMSQGLVESWLAGPEKSWARTPNKLERIGLNQWLHVRLCQRKHHNKVSCRSRGGAGANKRKIKSRKEQWKGKSISDISKSEGLSHQAVASYCKRHGIKVAVYSKKP